jgi:hypothetical protein
MAPARPSSSTLSAAGAVALTAAALAAGTAAAAATAAAVGGAAPPNICATNAAIGRSVAAAVNLTWPGLEAVASAVAAGDYGAACDALVAYYADGNTTWWLRLPPVAPGTGLAGGAADEVAFHDVYSGVGSTVKVPRNADGGLDWLYKGPRNDVEFMNVLNRAQSWSPLLLDAYVATGNPVYPRYVSNTIIDWVTHLPCPNALSGGSPCVPLGVANSSSQPTCSWDREDPPGAQACATGTMESPWRSLEMGIRAQSTWPQTFFGFQGSPDFSTDARVLLLLGVAEHFSALMVDGGHPGRGTPNCEHLRRAGRAGGARRRVWPQPPRLRTGTLLIQAFRPHASHASLPPPPPPSLLCRGDAAVGRPAHRRRGVAGAQQRVDRAVHGAQVPAAAD